MWTQKPPAVAILKGMNQFPKIDGFSHSFPYGADVRGCITSHCSRAVWEAAGGLSRISSHLQYSSECFSRLP